MPQMGFDMREGRIVRWLKNEGDSVARSESIAEIETDKAIVEVEAFASGVLKQILAQPGQTVPVGEPIAVLADTQEAAAAPVIPAAPQARAPQAAGPATALAAPPTGRVKASPLARRLARERGIDLSTLTGSGPGGRILKADVERATAQQVTATSAPPAPAVPSKPTDFTAARVAPAAVTAPAAPAAVQTPLGEGRPIPPAAPSEVLPHTRIRQAIARRMSESKQTAPHFYVTVAIDMTEAMSMREKLNQALEREGTKISVNDLIVKATADALPHFPELNAAYDDGGTRLFTGVDIAVAVALEGGLITPVITGCDKRSLREISVLAKDMVARARSGKLKPEEMTGGTFTISNLGMFDVESFIAIINPPQSAILAVGATRPEPVVNEGAIQVAQMMRATLSADHRVTDGAQAAKFLGHLKSLLQNPWALLA